MGECIYTDDPDLDVENVDFCNIHLVLILRDGRQFRLGSLTLPFPAGKGPVSLRRLHPHYLPLPKCVSQISPGTNYDYYSSTVCFMISSPVMPDAIVDYDLSNGERSVVQRQNFLHERIKVLYGASSSSSISKHTSNSITIDSTDEVGSDDGSLWNDLSEFYACEHHHVSSYDAVGVPLTIVYSPKNEKDSQYSGLLHGHGAYGELLDKQLLSELKSLIDRGWIVTYADVRGQGGGGEKWHYDGGCTKKTNFIKDYISCAKYLIGRELVHENKLADWNYSAGGLLVALAINSCPDLFQRCGFEGSIFRCNKYSSLSHFTSYSC